MIRWGLAVAITVLSASVTNAQPVPRTLTYCTRGDTSLRLDLYMPEPVEGPVPVVLALFGGSGYFGDRGLFQSDSEYIELRTRLLEKGMAVAAPDYRLRTRWQAGIQDARCAVRYLRANANTINIDPARIAATGISWGGQLALLLALGGSRPDWDSGEHMEQSSKVQAVAAFVANPAAEQKSLHDHTIAAIAKDQPPALFQQVSMTVFGTLEPVPDYAPNTHVRPGAPPVFLALGLNDSWVHIDHGTVFMRSLATAKVPSTLVYVPSGHEGTVRLAAREASDFLIRALMAAGR